MAYKNWQEYWTSVSARLDAHIAKLVDQELMTYLTNVFGLYSWVVEDWETKVTKNKDQSKQLSIFLIETQDLMRGIVACYGHLTMAPLTLILRTAFEIRVNLKFIVGSADHVALSSKFARFSLIEEFLGQKAGGFLSGTEADNLKRLKTQCPEWFEAGTDRLDDRKLNWTATRTNLREQAKATHVNLEQEYVQIYKVNSKFTHASPIIAKLYKKGASIGSIPSEIQSAQFAILGMGQCMEILEEACTYFGVEFPSYDKAILDQIVIKAMTRISAARA